MHIYIDSVIKLVLIWILLFVMIHFVTYLVLLCKERILLRIRLNLKKEKIETEN